MEKPRYRVSVSTEIDFDIAVSGTRPRKCISWGHVRDYESGDVKQTKCWKTGKTIDVPRYPYGKTVWKSKGYFSEGAARRSAEKQLKKLTERHK